MDVVSDVLGGHMKLVGGVRKILHIKIQDPGPGGHCAAADNHHHTEIERLNVNQEYSAECNLIEVVGGKEKPNCHQRHVCSATSYSTLAPAHNQILI